MLRLISAHEQYSSHEGGRGHIQAAGGPLGAAMGGVRRGCCRGAKGRVFLHPMSSDPAARGRPRLERAPTQTDKQSARRERDSGRKERRCGSGRRGGEGRDGSRRGGQGREGGRRAGEAVIKTEVVVALARSD